MSMWLKRLFPYPLLTALLYGMWVLLTGFSVGHMVLGLVIATLVSRTALSLKLTPPELRFGRPLLRLVGHVVQDVITSNYQTAKFILSSNRQRRSAFVYVPLELKNPYALATMAMILTATPGTLWLEHDPKRGRLLMHVLDLDDEAALIALIKSRYETPLLEIFG